MALSREDAEGIKVFGMKLAKRGNDKYRWRVYNRFKEVHESLPEVCFFNPKDRGIKKTRALFLTLSYDTKIGPWQDAWIDVGKEFNRFKANLTKRFGRVSPIFVYGRHMRTGTLTFTVYCSLRVSSLTYSEIRRVDTVFVLRVCLRDIGIVSLMSRLCMIFEVACGISGSISTRVLMLRRLTASP